MNIEELVEILEKKGLEVDTDIGGILRIEGLLYSVWAKDGEIQLDPICYSGGRCVVSGGRYLVMEDRSEAEERLDAWLKDQVEAMRKESQKYLEAAKDISECAARLESKLP